MKKTRKISSIILQVALLFCAGILIIGLLTYYSQGIISDAHIKEQTEHIAEEAADEVRMAVKEYPAYQWLLQFWYDHAYELDMEYDVGFTGHTVTEEKCALWSERHPDIQLRYATELELKDLPLEDQKLYAEITYTWLITNINHIKRIHDLDYLFGLVTDDSYGTQFFLFSAGDGHSLRGSNYEEVYTLGTVSDATESQQEAMRKVLENDHYLADAGKYMDYYTFLTAINDRNPVLIGLTYNVDDLTESIVKERNLGTGNVITYLAIFALICLGFMYGWVLRPLRKVQQSIRGYKITKDSRAVAENLSGIRSRNEIGELSEDVVSMTEAIDNYVQEIETITSEKERISVELSLASRIQANMLPNIFPPFPDRKEIEIYASMTPAKEVGGDFYDFFLIDEDHLCMTIADVSGKGVPAALFMMASRIMLADNAMMRKSPAEILEDTNNAICANNKEEMFLTVWLGILDLRTGHLAASNAGHEYPVVQNEEGSFEVFKDRHGIVIGAMPGMKYPEYEMVLQPHTKLFLYTDGAPEATNGKQEMFGMQRMVDLLNEKKDANPRKLLDQFQDGINAFVGAEEQFDDLTMMCLEYNGPADPEKA